MLIINNHIYIIVTNTILLLLNNHRNFFYFWYLQFKDLCQTIHRPTTSLIPLHGPIHTILTQTLDLAYH